MCSRTDLCDGTVDISQVADMNEQMIADAENDRRSQDEQTANAEQERIIAERHS